MEFDPYSDSTNLKMGRQTRLVDNMIIGTLSEFRSIAASAKTINMMFTSSKTRIIYNNVRQAVINNEARPDIVVGTDTNYYQVKLQGDTVSDNKPTTGLTCRS